MVSKRPILRRRLLELLLAALVMLMAIAPLLTALTPLLSRGRRLTANILTTSWAALTQRFSEDVEIDGMRDDTKFILEGDKERVDFSRGGSSQSITASIAL